jgi:hypothetical protein
VIVTVWVPAKENCQRSAGVPPLQAPFAAFNDRFPFRLCPTLGKESKLSYTGNLFGEESQRADRRCGSLPSQRDRGTFHSTAARRESSPWDYRSRDAALIMLEKLPGTQPVTVGGDKGFDTFGFVAECRHLPLKVLCACAYPIAVRHTRTIIIGRKKSRITYLRSSRLEALNSSSSNHMAVTVCRCCSC